ncbi:MAG: HEAT repeat domain-containing protein [Myxococcales bacterium]|jgi:hypothetical protein|nr:HEAT repeat domain-containing protein [Myxococcales bacterium]
MTSDKNKNVPPEAAEPRPNTQPHPKRARRAPTFAIALYVFLALSAAVALLGRKNGLVPDMARIGAPIAFAAFFALFAIYRFALVRGRRYSPGKAFVQIGIGALFLLMLAPGVLNLRSNQDALEPVARLMLHADPSVRALACDAFGQQSPAEMAAALPKLESLVGDPHPGVRARAQRALDRLRFSAPTVTAAAEVASLNAPKAPEPEPEPEPKSEAP